MPGRAPWTGASRCLQLLKVFSLLVVAAALQNVSSDTLSLVATSPASGAVNILLSEFNILLTFSDSVQAGEGVITVEVGTAPFIRVVESVDCRTGLDFIGKHALLPIRQELRPLRVHTVHAPGTCFEDSSGETFAGNDTEVVLLTFTAMQRGPRDVVAYDFVPPSVHLPMLGPGSDNWLEAGGAVVLYFSERIEAGVAELRFRLVLPEAVPSQGHCGEHSPQLDDSASADHFDDVPANLTFDDRIPGKVLVEPSDSLPRSSMYELVFELGAFVDTAGNYLPASVNEIFGVPSYILKVSTVLVSTVPHIQELTTALGTNLVLVFEDRVRLPAESPGLTICEVWPTFRKNQVHPRLPDPPDGGCLFRYALPNASMLISGNRVFSLLPNLTQLVTYKVFVPTGMLEHFENSSLIDVDGGSKFVFEVPQQAVDSSGPQLFVAMVACAGRIYVPGEEPLPLDYEDEDNESTIDYGEPIAPPVPGGWVCQRGHVVVEDFQELREDVMCDCAVLKLLFQERVIVGNGSTFLWVEEEDTPRVLFPEVYWHMQSGSLHPLLSGSVATFDLGALAYGTAYRVQVGRGTVMDQAVAGNPSEAMQFHFKRPMPQPTIFPADGTMEVAPTTAIKLTFASAPRFSDDENNPAFLVLVARWHNASYNEGPGDAREIRNIPLTSAEETSVIIRDMDVLIMPNPPLLAGVTYEVSLSRGAVRHMEDGIRHSFSTRLEDIVEPKITFAFPHGEVDKLELATRGLLVIFTEAVLLNPRSSILLLEDEKLHTVFAEEQLGCSGRCNEPCIEFDETHTRLSIYPAGTAHPLNSWTRLGSHYVLEFLSGSMSDAFTVPPLLANNIMAVNITFQVVGDERGPVLVSSMPQDGTIGIDPWIREVILEFDEELQPGDNTYRVLARHETRSPPNLRYDVSPTLISPLTGMVIPLVFDTSVRPGHGFLSLHSTETGHTIGQPVDVENLTFVDNIVFYVPDMTGVYTEDIMYEEMFVRSSSREALESYGGDSLMESLDTQDLQTFVANGTEMEIVHSNLAEHVCLGASPLPDIELYMNEGIGSVRTATNSTSSFPIGGRRIWLYECAGGDCSYIEGRRLLWELVADEEVTDDVRLQVHVDPERSFIAVLHTSELPDYMPGSKANPLPLDREMMIILEEGLFLDAPPSVKPKVELEDFFEDCIDANGTTGCNQSNVTNYTTVDEEDDLDDDDYDFDDFAANTSNITNESDYEPSTVTSSTSTSTTTSVSTPSSRSTTSSTSMTTSTQEIEVISDSNSTNLTNGSDFDDDADDRFESSASAAADLISSADSEGLNESDALDILTESSLMPVASMDLQGGDMIFSDSIVLADSSEAFPDLLYSSAPGMASESMPSIPPNLLLRDVPMSEVPFENEKLDMSAGMSGLLDFPEFELSADANSAGMLHLDVMSDMASQMMGASLGPFRLSASHDDEGAETKFASEGAGVPRNSVADVELFPPDVELFPPDVELFPPSSGPSSGRSSGLDITLSEVIENGDENEQGLNRRLEEIYWPSWSEAAHGSDDNTSNATDEFMGDVEWERGSPTLHIQFRTCNVKYDTLTKRHVHLYSSFASSTGAKLFEVVVPRGAALDILGNEAVELQQSVRFAHEADPPELDVNASFPMEVASVTENIVLTFSEPVQLGLGSFIFTSAEGQVFEVDVASIKHASRDGHSLVQGSQVLITPRTLCESPLCSLQVGSSYDVLVSMPGVVTDLIGNRLRKWEPGTFSFRVEDSPPHSPPFVLFSSGFNFDPNTLQLQGHIYCNERVQLSAGNDAPIHLSLKERHPGGLADNSKVSQEILVTTVSFGKGEVRGGADVFGLVTFNATLPMTNAQYTVTLLANSLVDSQASPGPEDSFIYHIDVGELAPGNRIDIAPPQIRPRGTRPLSGAQRVSQSTNITLWFTEEVKAGQGLVRFCANRDAVAEQPSTCVAGSFVDGTEAVVDVRDAIVDWREVTLPLPLDLAANQALSVVIPSGAFTDLDAGMNSMEPVDGSTYTFYIRDRDVRPPELAYWMMPSHYREELVLVFNEAVQTMGMTMDVMVTLPLQDGNVPLEFEVDRMHSQSTQDGAYVAELALSNDSSVWGDFLEDDDNSTDNSTGNETGEPPPIFWRDPGDGENGSTSLEPTQQSTSPPPSSTRPPSQTLSWSVERNVLRFHPQWIAGARYDFDWDSFFLLVTDLAGNPALMPLENMSRSIQINGDVQGPRPYLGHLSESPPVRLHMHATLTIEFSEPVTKGSSELKIVVEGERNCRTTVASIDAKVIPVVNVVKNQRLIPTAILQPTPPLLAGGTYRIIIGQEAFIDMNGNNCSNCTEMLPPVHLELEKDVTPPTLKAVDLGGQHMPEPAFDPYQGTIVLYFSETVQVVAPLPGQSLPQMELVPSDGGSHCSHGQHTCVFGEGLCNFDCLYDEALEPISVESNITVVGAKVIIEIDPKAFEQGHGYSLSIRGGMFSDLAGNRMADFDGADETGNGIVATWCVTVAEDDLVGPQFVGSPLDGELRLPSSTLIELHFTEIVKAGSGALHIVPLLPMGVEPPSMATIAALGAAPRPQPGMQNRSLVVLASRCHFEGTAVFCTPPEELMPNTAFAVVIDEDFVVDSYGNTAASGRSSVDDMEMSEVSSLENESDIESDDVFVKANMVFHVIDQDFIPPRLERVTDGAEDLHGSIAVSKGTLVVLHFSEVVQAGDGFITFIACNGKSRTQPCHEQEVFGTGGGIPTHNAHNGDIVEVDVNGPGLVFHKDVVYVSHHGLQGGTRYFVALQQPGIFEDLSGSPSPMLSIVSEFATLVDDLTPPEVVLMIPQNSTEVAEASGGSDVILYFSEPMQAWDPVREILLSDSRQVATIPVGNSSPQAGIVRVNGHQVRIDPYQDMGGARTISVEVEYGALADHSQNVFMGLQGDDYQYRTLDLRFYRMVPVDTTSTRFIQRKGPVFMFTETAFMIYGGSTHLRCLNDVWRSMDGIHWTRQPAMSNSSIPLPRVAYSAASVDSRGCVLVLADASHCEFQEGQDRMWKTCDDGVTWDIIPDPLVVPVGPTLPPAWPSSWEGHSVIFVGGWQLVIVDAARVGGGVWRFLDAGLEEVEQVAMAPLPFGERWSPQLAAASTGDIVMVGGLSASALSPEAEVFNDLWMSRDTGVTWHCLAAHFAAGVATPSVAKLPGMGKHFMLAGLRDDSMFLIGGQGNGNLYISGSPPWDVIFEAEPLLQVPSSVPLRRRGQDWLLYFGEMVSVVHPDSLYLTPVLAGPMHEQEEPREVNIHVETHGQVLRIHPLTPLLAGVTYGLAGVVNNLRDQSGNAVWDLEPGQMYHHTVTVNEDKDPPVVLKMLPEGMSVVPWTNFMIEFNEEIHSDQVDAVHLMSAAGEEVVVLEPMVSHGSKIVFRLPSTTPRLTEGMTYSIHVEPGAFMDSAGNPAELIMEGSFGVMSGAYSRRFSAWTVPANSLVDMTPVNLSSATVNNSQDIYPPVLLSITPPEDATDVPFQYEELQLQWHFSEEVRWAANGEIMLISSSGEVFNLSRAIYGHQFLHHPDGNILVIDTIPSSLRKPGVHLSVFVMKELITDLSGNHPEHDLLSTINFMQGEVDMEPPEVLLQRPSLASGIVSGSTTSVELFFSEEVELMRGNISLELVFSPYNLVWPPSSPRSFSIPVDSPSIACGGPCRVEVMGSKLTLMLPDGSLDVQGHWRIEVPAGCLRDLRRAGHHPSVSEGGWNQFLGYQGSFQTRLADKEPPSLLEVFPQNEHVATHRHPKSTAILLTFNEAVQAGSIGKVLLEPLYAQASTRVVMEAREAVIEGATVFFAPRHGLTPGQVYTLTVEPGAFRDMEGNNFAGLLAGSRFSIAPEEVFNMVAASRRRRREYRRYGGGIAVDASNRIWLATGHLDDDEVDPNQIPSILEMNDVWMMDTGRPTHCSSTHLARSNCSEQQCISGGDPAMPPTLGIAVQERRVWRSATLAGEVCLDTRGDIKNLPGMLIDTLDVTCPCPTCVYPPAAPSWRPLNQLEQTLPSFMVNTTYLSNYQLISANYGQTPLLCEEYREPSADFTCIVDTEHYGKYSVPYPSCVWKKCRTVPDFNAVPNFEEFVPEASTGGINCSSISPEMPLDHEGNCSFHCASGFVADGSFVCERGSFLMPECFRQTCPTLTIESGLMECLEGSQLGAVCDVICDAGHVPSVPNISCRTTSDLPEAPPLFQPIPECMKNTCGDYMLSEGANITYFSSMRELDTNASAMCMEGYEESSAGLFLTCAPVVSLAGLAAVEWKSLATGRVAGPVCIPTGQTLIELFTVTGVVTMVLEIAAWCDSSGLLASSRAAVQDAVAAGVTAGGTYVLASSVVHLLLDICQDSSRRLQEAGSDIPAAGEAAASLEYGIRVPNAEVAESLVEQVRASRGNAVFASRFGESLAQAGLSVRGIGVEVPSTVITFETQNLQTTPPPPSTSSTSSVHGNGGQSADGHNNGSSHEPSNGNRDPGYLEEAPRSANEESSNAVAIVLGSVFGTLGLICCCVLMGCLVRRGRSSYMFQE